MRCALFYMRHQGARGSDGPGLVSFFLVAVVVVRARLWDIYGYGYSSTRRDSGRGLRATRRKCGAFRGGG